MKFENTRVYNFEGALKGMRNPKNSWDKSDSIFGLDDYDYVVNLAATTADIYYKEDNSKNAFEMFVNNGILQEKNDVAEYAFIGAKDMKLAQNLIRAGSEHRKFMRQIFVSVDITAPQFWFSEFDTYKIGTVANSTSKMHKLATTPITLDCFEIGDFQEIEEFKECPYSIINYCEELRLKYLETKDKKYWKELIRWLPESWLQTRTVTMNYENLLGMCSKNQRRFHKLTEWSNSFISWARSLPYAQQLIFLDELENEEN
jgi:hypothetical protein